jgi:putative ABC transport system permease protein
MWRLGSRTASRWRALTGSASAAAAALGLLVCLFTLPAVAAPRAIAEVRTDAFRQLAAAAPATDKAVIGTVPDATLGAGQPQGLDAGLIERTKGQLRSNMMTLPLSRAAADWSSLTTPFLAVTGYGRSAVAVQPPQLELSYRDALARNVRVIAGMLPGGIVRSRSTVIVQTAATEATARRFGLRVGSRLALPGTSFVLVVTAIVQPRDSAAPFWTIDPVVTTPQLEILPAGALWDGGLFIPAAAVGAMQDQINAEQMLVTWLFPLALGKLTAAQATQLQPTLTHVLATAGNITVGGGGLRGAKIPVTVTLTSGASQFIAGFEAEAASVGSALDMLSVSLAVLAAVGVLLSGWLLTERRRQDFAVLRSRGASRRQLALAVLAGTAVTAVPAAVAGAAIAVALTPSAPAVLSWWLAGLVVLAALAGPVMITVRTHRGYAAVVRPDAPPAQVPALRRLVVESTLVAGSAAGLVVLRYQGAGAAGDVYTSAAPALLAIGVAVILVRIYPQLARGTLRLRGQRAGAATFLGLARAGRASATAALPAFALVLALALVSFAGMERSAVQRGEVVSSWQQAGADAVISEPGTISQALQRAVTAVPGVQHLATAGITTAGASNGQFDVLVVDPHQYAAILAGSPLPQPPSVFSASAQTGVVPALAAPQFATETSHGPVRLLIGEVSIRVRVVGQAASLSALSDLAGGYLVLPRQALGKAAPPPTMLLVGGPDLDQAALRAVVERAGPGAAVVFRSRLLASLERAPLQHGAYLALALGGVAAGVYGLLVLLLSLLLSAPARALVLARMSTMGLSGGQGRLLGVVELVPQLVAVVAGGLGCAVALVPLIGPALSLGVFTGSGSSVPVRVEPWWLVAGGAGLLVLAAAAVAVQTLLTGRTAARSLRMGE